jgi:xylulose-5-phosphate/fructose-6-phosphate phosphoketolase
MSIKEKKDIKSIELYCRAANYICVALLYLKENVLLKNEIQDTNFKDSILGHWGCNPGINMIYCHLSNLIKQTKYPIHLIVGTGHAGPSILANSFLEQSLQRYYPKFSYDEKGLENLCKSFGSHNGFDTEITADYPNALYCGGELGNAIAFSQGLVIENSTRVIACVIGDGEFETATTSSSWLSFKFLRPGSDGIVLPIINGNGFKMGSSSLFSELSKEELTKYFNSLSLCPLFADNNHYSLQNAFFSAWQMIKDFLRGKKGHIPVIVLYSQKGFSAPLKLLDKPFMGTVNSHKPILKSPRFDKAELNEVYKWLNSYIPSELFNIKGEPNSTVLKCLPSDIKQRMGNSILDLFPKKPKSNQLISKSIKSVVSNNAESAANAIKLWSEKNKNYGKTLVVCPDELISNKFSVLQKEPIPKNIRVIEMLNEHICNGWMQGYTVGNGVGVFISYEAFAPLIDSMISQQIKYLERYNNVKFRGNFPSCNYILTSLGWHNCYSHQNPGTIDTILGRGLKNINVFTPDSLEMTESTINYMLSSKGKINIMLISKIHLERVKENNSNQKNILKNWKIYTYSSKNAIIVDIVGVGDCMIEECLAAKEILEKCSSNIDYRVISINKISLLDNQFDEDLQKLKMVFEESIFSIWAFLGYPKTIKNMLWGWNKLPIDILGYKDVGKTTTYQGMYLLNECSRYDIAIRVVERLEVEGLIKQNTSAEIKLKREQEIISIP